MFGKKDKNVVVPSYSNWEQDLGFLHYLLKIKQKIVWSTTIDIILSKPVINGGHTAVVTDEDAKAATSTIVQKVSNSLADGYKKFLLSKYFQSEEAFLEYLVETVYFDTLMYANGKNIENTHKTQEEAIAKNRAKQRIAAKKSTFKDNGGK